MIRSAKNATLKNKAKSFDKISKDIFQKITKKLKAKFKKYLIFSEALKIFNCEE